MDGQITLTDYMADLEAAKYRPEIPKLDKRWLEEERWIDDWHYTCDELPPEADIYFTIHEHYETYMYRYTAYVFGHWYRLLYAEVWGEVEPPFAWVRVPLEYRRERRYKLMQELFGLIRKE